MLKYIAILMLFCLFYCAKSTTRHSQGAYKTTLINMRNCTAKEVIRPHSEYGTFLKYHADIFNSSGKSYMKINFTLLKDLDHIKARVRSFIWEDNQWAMRLRIPGFGCYRQIFRLFFQVVHWKLDVNKCSVSKGSGSVNRVDVDKYQHAWERETEYGRWLWLYEGTSMGKTVICIAFENIVTPIGIVNTSTNNSKTPHL